jgi:leucyl aminopeptidase
VEPDEYLIELAPGETRLVTEDEKWALRRVMQDEQSPRALANDSQEGINFFDITHTPNLGSLNSKLKTQTVTFPSKTAHNETLQPLLKKLEKKNMRKHLEKFTSFHTRYYKSSSGVESSAWLLAQVNSTLSDAGASNASVKAFPHPWGQSSIIATIPGKSNRTVVIGAHQDSINLFFPSLLAAPGADDDGSGTVTILEALRVLLKSEEILKGKAENTVEFHWYSAEEGGLLGSQAIFQSYEKEGRDVKAMLQQDMTGYVQKTIDAGEPESVGVITDFVDAGLTECKSNMTPIS